MNRCIPSLLKRYRRVSFLAELPMILLLNLDSIYRMSLLQPIRHSLAWVSFVPSFYYIVRLIIDVGKASDACDAVKQQISEACQLIGVDAEMMRADTACRRALALQQR